MKKLLLVLFCLCGLAWGAYQVFPIFKSLYTFENGSSSGPAPGVRNPSLDAYDPNAPLRAIDVDAMASRMKEYKDIYQKLRDDALAVHARLHPAGSKHSKEEATAIRLAAYLWVWGDFYKEGLSKTFIEYVRRIESNSESGGDPLLNEVSDIECMQSFYPNEDSRVEELKKRAELLQNSDYPEAFKFWASVFMVQMLNKVEGHPQFKQPMAKSIALMPEMAGRMVEQYAALYKERLPDYLLYLKGTDCLDNAQNDAGALASTAAGIDRIFESEAPSSVVRPSLQGRFYVDYAWNARGSDWANTVTNEGWRLMNERLVKAGEILEKAAMNHPGEKMIAHNMMTVELGQGSGRDRMEKWFHTAIDTDPDDFKAYDSKLYYLLPRWYGSDEEIWKFGLECAKTQNWEARIPMVLVSAMEDAAINNPRIYANTEIWKVLEVVFRGYLQHYPESTIYRSKFAKYAAQGEHWEIAKQQFAVLGNEWDRDVFSDEEYVSMKRDAEQNAKK